MTKRGVNRVLAAVAASLLLVNSAIATDGYFLTGYGTKQQGRGGTGVALPGDSLTAATNPAGLTLVGDRLDFGLTLFRPIRSGTIVGNQLPPGYPDVNGTYDASRVKDFFLPELGYSHLFRPNLAVGVALYGNGGLNTSYTTPIPLLGTTRGGVDLEQLFISPALAYKLGAHHSFGIAANIAYQRFAAEGIQNFANANYSTDPTNVTNNGYSNSYGAGVRIGWIGELSRYLNVGATYQTQTYASKFSRYSGLFAQGGKFDIPANFAGGVAVRISPKAAVQFDAERILYGQIKAVANSGANQAPLGASNGPRLWMARHYRHQDRSGLRCELRAHPAGRLQLLPGSFQRHASFLQPARPCCNSASPAHGRNLDAEERKEINFANIHAFEGRVSGVNAIPPAAGGGDIDLHMDQNSFQVSFGWKKSGK